MNEFRSNKTHKTLGNNLADTLSKNSMLFSGKKCSNKWTSFKRDYKTTIDYNYKSGS